MDDASVGRALRALRIRKHWRQEDVAAAAGLSQSLVSRAERGHVGELQLRTIRGLFAALDASCTLAPWWRSGQLDRLLDEDHAATVGRALAFLERNGWSANVEVTFAIYGDRGSIDVLATRRSDQAALVVEVKTRLMSVEELLRTLDRKVRLAAGIVHEREGWRPTVVGRMVALADDSTNRRRVGRAVVLESALPLRGGILRNWLREPMLGVAGRGAGRTGGTGAGPAGLVFLSLSSGATGRRRIVAPRRVRTPISRLRGELRPAKSAQSVDTSPGEGE